MGSSMSAFAAKEDKLPVVQEGAGAASSREDEDEAVGAPSRNPPTLSATAGAGGAGAAAGGDGGTEGATVGAAVEGLPGFWVYDGHGSHSDDGEGGEDVDDDDGDWEDDEEGIDDDDESEGHDADAAQPLARDPNRGCTHYVRGCKLVSPCCGEVFWCRFCHNEKWEGAADATRRHTLDRSGRRATSHPTPLQSAGRRLAVNMKSFFFIFATFFTCFMAVG